MPPLSLTLSLSFLRLWPPILSLNIRDYMFYTLPFSKVPHPSPSSLMYSFCPPPPPPPQPSLSIQACLQSEILRYILYVVFQQISLSLSSSFFCSPSPSVFIPTFPAPLLSLSVPPGLSLFFFFCPSSPFSLSLLSLLPPPLSFCLYFLPPPPPPLSLPSPPPPPVPLLFTKTTKRQQDPSNHENSSPFAIRRTKNPRQIGQAQVLLGEEKKKSTNKRFSPQLTPFPSLCSSSSFFLSFLLSFFPPPPPPFFLFLFFLFFFLSLFLCLVGVFRQEPRSCFSITKRGLPRS